MLNACHHPWFSSSSLFHVTINQGILITTLSLPYIPATLCSHLPCNAIRAPLTTTSPPEYCRSRLTHLFASALASHCVALPECSFKDLSSQVTFLLNTFSWLPFSVRIKYKALTGVQKVLQELALIASQIASATLSRDHSAPAIRTWVLLSAKHDFCLRTFTPAIFSAPFLHGCLADFIQVSLEAAPHWKDCPCPNYHFPTCTSQTFTMLSFFQCFSPTDLFVYLFFVCCPPPLESKLSESRGLFCSVHYGISKSRTVLGT